VAINRLTVMLMWRLSINFKVCQAILFLHWPQPGSIQ